MTTNTTLDDAATTVSPEMLDALQAQLRVLHDQCLALAVRGGGHSGADLFAVSGGLLLDLAPMRGVGVSTGGVS